MYKNWKAICDITDTRLMWAMALLDLEADFGQDVAKRFPEYFSEKEQAGPVPLSVLKMKAEENAAREGFPGTGSGHLATYDAIPEWMPIFHFSLDEHELRYEGIVLPPDEINAALQKEEKIGKVYRWADKEIVLIVLVDSINNAGEWYFVPAELIVIDK